MIADVRLRIEKYAALDGPCGPYWPFRDPLQRAERGQASKTAFRNIPHHA
jgi:hypothetical protein